MIRSKRGIGVAFMYPGFVGAGEPVDQRDPARGTQSEHGNSNQLQRRTSQSE